MTVLDVDPVAPYDRKLVLSRPDQYVAWRGDTVPDDPLALIDRVRGAHFGQATAGGRGA
jgi:hypothetical protein